MKEVRVCRSGDIVRDKCISVEVGIVAISVSLFTTFNDTRKDVSMKTRVQGVYSGCHRVTEEREAKNGKDGVADPVYRTNRSEGKESVQSIGLEEQRIGDNDRRLSEMLERYVRLLK